MSKGLEILENAKKRDGLPLNTNFAPITEKEIEIIEQELKALEIIREKNVDIQTLKRTNNVYEYNSYVAKGLGEKPLTQEEYDLLKEVML